MTEPSSLTSKEAEHEIALIRGRLESICDAELMRTKRRLKNGLTQQQQQQELRATLYRMVDKLIHPFIAELEKNGGAISIESVHKLFGLTCETASEVLECKNTRKGLGRT